VIPERIPSSDDLGDGVEWARAVCELAQRWQVDAQLLYAIAHAQAALPFRLHIFSGSRTAEEQRRLSSTPFALSTHADHDQAGCPRNASGVDVQPILPGVRASRAAVAQMGAAFVLRGLRWGGGAPVDSEGIPVAPEMWHVDLGPRVA
jgi:hypothetical protein